jgi:hypothetical protein
MAAWVNCYSAINAVPASLHAVEAHAGSNLNHWIWEQPMTEATDSVRLTQLRASMGMFPTVSIVPRAIWHSTQSDRAQREMLRAALDAAAVEHLFGRNQAIEDIKWLLNEADKLAERRNNALHAPYVIIADHHGTRFAPMDFSGNPRAAKLVKKDLLIEFAWYADCARVLSDYAFAVQYAPALPHQPWPGRPALPVLQQKKSRPNPRPRQP